MINFIIEKKKENFGSLVEVISKDKNQSHDYDNYDNNITYFENWFKYAKNKTDKKKQTPSNEKNEEEDFSVNVRKFENDFDKLTENGINKNKNRIFKDFRKRRNRKKSRRGKKIP